MNVIDNLRRLAVRQVALIKHLLSEREQLMGQIDDLNTALAAQAAANTDYGNAVTALGKAAKNIPAGTDLSAAVAAAQQNANATTANTVLLNAITAGLPQNPAAST